MAPLLFIGAALGGAAMYFFDPEKGRRRRALVRDQAVKASHDMRDFVDKGKRDLKNRGTVATARVRSLLTRRKATDDVLAERVRAKMGHYVAHPGAIEVSASGGQVTLAGSILSHEHGDLIRAIAEVHGVRDVIDQLAVYETARGISELQGGRERPGESGEMLQDNWAPGTRLVTGAAGTGITLYGLMRSRHLAGFIALATGVAILTRTITNKPLRRAAGLEGYRAVDVQKTIDIEAPVEQVFLFLANYENFPHFMRNVLGVETLVDGRSHWKVAGPAGTVVEWDAITTRLDFNERLEWSTVEGSTVEHVGRIRMEPLGNGTRVHVQMSYTPPAGVVGHAVAKLLGSDPKTQLDQDLMRLKSTLETGKVPRDAAAARQGETTS
ncbi:MAG TPA: SRPBCC family protein [Burkholderiales bacterium]|nr:SRPBCC family protein [Burkholderiales bacterium]